ncbi:MAG: hypothetical protein CML29_17575 [Rhizobiales bacterium]|nr:hypothetical protein [Hyphomicrobiales bacterium]MBA70178.1 hypothetical protein [Hyphomicrobiales bacterium]|tara:strand:+ start:126 stop:494 length:369 start_codon:yes stop_codon:yes gene_type:complete
METTITWGDLSAFLVAIVVVGGALAGIWWRIHQTISKVRDEGSAERRALSARIEEVRAKGAKELDTYKLEVANRYATADAIREVEGRVVEAINRLGDRLDSLFAPKQSKPRSRPQRRPGGGE